MGVIKTGKTYVKLQDIRNLNFVNTVGKPEISDGVFRIYDANSVTIDYEPTTNILTYHGTATGEILYKFIENDAFNLTAGNAVITKTTISGTASSGLYRFPISSDGVSENQMGIGSGSQVFTSNANRGMIRINTGVVFNQFKTLIQIEVGTEPTDYQIPYSEYTKHLYLAQIKKKYLKVDSEKLVEYKPNFSMRTD